MMTFYLNFPLFMYMVGLSMFILKCKYLLMMLMSLEFMMLSLYLLMFYMFSFYMDYYFGLVYVSIMVCEGVLGLSVLVLMVRSYGNDFFQSLNILW